mgnify:CR=1 FL=1
MCDLLGASDERTVCVLLDGLNNILSAARKQGEVDKVCAVIEECEGLDKIESLQTHENEEVYQKALEIIDTFFITPNSYPDLSLLILNSDHGFYTRWLLNSLCARLE